MNGTVNTVGSVPAASLAANVGPVHWYSTDFTVIEGLAFSNSATWLLNCWIAAGVLPGISEATLIVTFGPRRAPLCGRARSRASTATRLARMTATVVALRVDFIVSFLPRLNDTVASSLGRLAEPDRCVMRKHTSLEVVARD